MERVLALQSLSEAGAVDPIEPAASSGSNICSSDSGAGGRSGCSNGCRESEEMDW